MTYDFNKLLKLFMLASGRPSQSPSTASDADWAEDSLPKLTDEEQKACDALPTDIIAAMNRRQQQLQGQSASTVGVDQAQPAGFLMRGDADRGRELERQILDAEDEELKKRKTQSDQRDDDQD